MLVACISEKRPSHVRCLPVNIRSVGALITIIVCSQIVYTAYVSERSFSRFATILSNPTSYYPMGGIRFGWDPYTTFAAYSMEFSGRITLIIRIIEEYFALISAYLVWKEGTNAFPKIKKRVSNALILEGVYFLFFIPSIIYLLGFSSIAPSTIASLSILFTAKILLISPFLISLGLKVRKYEPGKDESSLLRLAGLSSLTYVIALWLDPALKWADMASQSGTGQLLGRSNVVLFLNMAVILSTALVFAVFGIMPILRKREIRAELGWWGVSLTLMALYFVIYTLYSAYFGLLAFVSRDELWIMSVLGLGLYLARRKS